MDPAQPTSGKYLDPRLGGECNTCGNGGCTICAAGGHRRNVGNTAFLNVIAARNELGQFVVKPNPNLSTHNRDHRRHSTFAAYRVVQCLRDRQTFGIRETVRDDGGFESYDRRFLGKRVQDFLCNL